LLCWTAIAREKYWSYEYEEVITPNIYNFDLWKTSGHADHYRENMFSFEIEKQEFGLKPMNCPGARAQAGSSFSLGARTGFRSAALFPDVGVDQDGAVRQNSSHYV
jgi:hypothetical protein